MVEPAHSCLSILAQCRLLLIGRSSYYYAPVPESDETLALMRVIDAAFLDMRNYPPPCQGGLSVIHTTDESEGTRTAYEA